VVRALGTVLRPATLTTLSLCVGFLTMTAAELRYQIEFAISPPERCCWRSAFISP